MKHYRRRAVSLSKFGVLRVQWLNQYVKLQYRSEPPVARDAIHVTPLIPQNGDEDRTGHEPCAMPVGYVRGLFITTS
jgi:hypothetical protein